MIGLHEQIETALSGRYQIERELGRGGMAIVYLARDLKHSRRVAVKVLRPELATSLGAERFLREINVAAGLSHPNIVPLYDSGEVDDLLYYVMPYVEGESLRDRLERERQLPIDESLAIARQVASALDYAHAKGVVHRDIKPENILLRGDQVLVADFGLARALYTASSSRLTRSGMAVGTPAYMSPEQASGDSHVDGRTDVYGLACVLFEMVAGVPPFRGATAQAVIAHHVATPAPSLCGERRSCPSALDAAVRRAMAKVPADRFRTAGELVRAAERVGASWTPVGAGRRRRRVWSTAGALAAVAVALILAVGMRLYAAPARTFERGQGALVTGDLQNATALLRKASASDLQAASLWLAFVLFLQDRDSTDEYARALSRVGQPALLNRADQIRLRALRGVADRDFAQACNSFRTLASSISRDAIARFSLARCISRDSVVVPDDASPSRWSFRTSHDEAIRLYSEILTELPRPHALRRVIYPEMVRLIQTEWGQTRRGYAYADRSIRFGAYPSLRRSLTRDTIAHVPFRLADLAPGRAGAEVPENELAVEHGRVMLRRVALAWADEAPMSSAAFATVARALEESGEVGGTSAGLSALAAVRRARRLTADRREVVLLIQDEARLLIKRGDFDGARKLADSVLTNARGLALEGMAGLAPLAALTGRAHEAARYLRQTASEFVAVLPDGSPYHPRPELGATAQALLAYASLGAPKDSLVVLRDRLERDLRSYESDERRAALRAALLARPLSLSVPVLGPQIIATVPADANQLLQMQHALLRGDAARVRAELDSLQRLRRRHLAGAVALDRTYHEAWLRLAIGDTAKAIQQLDLPLTALTTLRRLALRTVPEAAAIGRTMQLREELARRAGDLTTAQRWRHAVTTLWRNADF